MTDNALFSPTLSPESQQDIRYYSVRAFSLSCLVGGFASFIIIGIHYIYLIKAPWRRASWMFGVAAIALALIAYMRTQGESIRAVAMVEEFAELILLFQFRTTLRSRIQLAMRYGNTGSGYVWIALAAILAGWIVRYVVYCIA